MLMARPGALSLRGRDPPRAQLLAGRGSGPCGAPRSKFQVLALRVGAGPVLLDQEQAREVAQRVSLRFVSRSPGVDLWHHHMVH